MKTLVIAAGLMAALNSSMVWGDLLVSTASGASEPVRMVVWGIALFAAASTLKRRSASQDALSGGRQRSWYAGVLPTVGELASNDQVTVDASKLHART